MKQKRIAVLGVVYPGIEKFIDAYLSALQKQTRKDFTLVVINDGLAGFARTAKKYDLNVDEVSFHHTPAKIREFGINTIKRKGYDYLIFTDADDFISANRIEVVTRWLANYVIVANDLATINEHNAILTDRYISRRINNLSRIDREMIFDKNILGFTNTSLRLDCLKDDVCFPEDLKAVDWYFFNQLLLNGCPAIFTADATSYYRLYDNNLAGLAKPLTYKIIKRDIEIKCQHYENFANIDARYQQSFLKMTHLKNRLQDVAYRKRYVKKIQDHKILHPFWWEEISVKT